MSEDLTNKSSIGSIYIKPTFTQSLRRPILPLQHVPYKAIEQALDLSTKRNVEVCLQRDAVFLVRIR